MPHSPPPRPLSPLGLLRRCRQRLARQPQLQALLSHLRRQSLRTGFVLLALNFVCFGAAMVAGLYLRPVSLGLTVAALCYLLSKLLRYASFVILAAKGFNKVQQHHRKKSKD